MRCPRCEDASLSPLEAGEVEIDHCVECGGCFYDGGEFQAIEGLSLRGQHEVRALDLSCPRCDRPMAEIPWPHIPQVVADVCTGCQGVWLDQGEGAKLREAARRGPRVFSHQGRHYVLQRRRGGGALSWRWVGLGAIVLVLAQLLSSAVGAMFEGIPSLGEQGLWARVSSQLLAFLLGGAITARLSDRHTVVEPALAAFPAALLVAVLGWEELHGVALIALGLGGMVLAPLGALVAERLLGRFG